MTNFPLTVVKKLFSDISHALFYLEFDLFKVLGVAALVRIAGDEVALSNNHREINRLHEIAQYINKNIAIEKSDNDYRLTP